jgi:hypothetical protein
MSSKAPDLTKIGAMSSPQNMNISTSIIEPIQHDDSFCRFVLMNRGILHSNSKLQLALGKAGVHAFLPTNVGSHGLIQRCVLKAGSKTISETDDWNHLQGYHSMFVANERRTEREGVLTGRVGNYGYDSDNLVRIENFHEFDATNNQTMHAYQSLDHQPTWQVTLSELFPFLKQIQLPLYCMKDQLSIEIHFAPQSQRYWLRQSEVGGTYTIDKTQTKMIVDYIYYDQDSMDTYQRQIETKGFQIPIFDHVLIRNSIALSGNDILNYTRNLGCANRMVNKVIVANTNENQGSTSMNNTFNSQWNSPVDHGDFLLNLKYNDRFVWPRDIDNRAHAFSLLTAAESLPPFVLKDEYDGSRKDGMTKNTFEGYALDDMLQDCPKQYITLKPNRGDRVNGRGLDLNMTLKRFPAQSPSGTSLDIILQRVWCETSKVITLKDGRLSCVYA